MTAVPSAATRPAAPAGLTRASAAPAVQRRALPVVTPSASRRTTAGPSAPTAPAPPVTGEAGSGSPAPRAFSSATDATGAAPAASHGPTAAPAGPDVASPGHAGGSAANTGPAPSVSVQRSPVRGDATDPGLPAQRRTSGGAGPMVPGATGSGGPAPATASPNPSADVPAPGRPRRRSALGAPLSSPPPATAPSVRLDPPGVGPGPGIPGAVRGTGVPAERSGAPVGGTSPATPSVGGESRSVPPAAGPPVQRAASATAPASSGTTGTRRDPHEPPARKDSGQSAGAAVPSRPRVRALTPARALTSALPAVPPATAVQRRTAPAAVPLRRVAPAEGPARTGGSLGRRPAPSAERSGSAVPGPRDGVTGAVPPPVDAVTAAPPVQRVPATGTGTGTGLDAGAGAPGDPSVIRRPGPSSSAPSTPRGGLSGAVGALVRRAVPVRGTGGDRGPAAAGIDSLRHRVPRRLPALLSSSGSPRILPRRLPRGPVAYP